jgi:hypothetical protein
VPPRPPGHLEPALLHPPLLQIVAAQSFTHRAASSWPPHCYYMPILFDYFFGACV